MSVDETNRFVHIKRQASALLSKTLEAYRQMWDAYGEQLSKQFMEHWENQLSPPQRQP
jgi:hypothetical protein